MSADLIAILTETTLAGSAALLLVLALRRPVRAALGANAAYALWLCVPVALFAVVLPRSADVPLALPVAWQVAPAMVVTATPEARAIDWREVLAPLWLAGVLASMALLAWQQRRFRRALGPLYRRADGLYQSRIATAGLPAVTGVLRPRILLPVDFEQRYTAPEQALVLQHERLHARRGDLVANALAALLRCLFWFNPLLPLALRRFRLDQELACDEGVIARNPRARRHYGEAMLKTHFDELPLPLGCHWQARHPIKERIDMLKRPTPSPLQWMAATLFAIALSASTGYAAWATQPAEADAADSSAEAGAYAIDVRMDVDGKARTFQLREQAGRTFGIRSEEPGLPVWEADLAVKPVDGHPDQVLIGGSLRADGRAVSDPALVATLGWPATIQVSTPDGRSIITLRLNVMRLGDTSAASSASVTHTRTAADPGDGQASAANAVPAVSGNGNGAWDQLKPVGSLPPPKYPVEAARSGVVGKVVLLLDVAADGRVTGVQVEEATPPGVFDANAVAAAWQWRFEPELRDGRPAAGRQRVPVTFSLDPPDEGAGRAQ